MEYLRVCVVPLCDVCVWCVCMCGWVVQGDGCGCVGLSWVSVCVCLCAFYLCVFVCVCVCVCAHDHCATDDFQRVCLRVTGRPGSDYINASWISVSSTKHT